MAISIDLSIGNSSGGGGGSVNTGVLQVSGGGALSGTLQTITDQSSNASPLQLSTTNLAMTFADTSGLFYGPYSAGGVYSGIWDNKIAVKNTTNFSLLSGNGETYLNANSGLYLSINGPSTPLINLTTSGFAIGQSTTAATARLQVRGDGTNPIALFQNGASVGRISIADVGTLTTTVASGQSNFSFGYVGNATYLNMNSNGVVTHYSTTAGSGIETFRVIADGVASHTSGAMRILQVSGAGFSPSSGTGIYRPFEINYTLNASGANTGTATGIFLNATETALNGMGHNLMDLQVGGVSQFRVSRIGDTTSNGTFVSLNSYTNFIGNRFQISSGLASNRTLFVAVGEGIMRISDATEANFNRLQLGGTTNAFPAIKRNAAMIDFRLADDSGFASANADSFYGQGYYGLRSDARVLIGGSLIKTLATGVIALQNSGETSFDRLVLGVGTNAFPSIKRNGAAIDFRLADDSGYADVVGKTFTSYASGVNSFVIDSSVASSGHGFVIQSYNTGLTGVALSLYSTSIFQADATAGGGVTLRGSGDSHTAYASALFAMKSTTKGFLPPTMTTTEVNAIASPAEGLVVFNTTISHLCVYQGGAWVKINHSPM